MERPGGVLETEGGPEAASREGWAVTASQVPSCALGMAGHVSCATCQCIQHVQHGCAICC